MQDIKDLNELMQQERYDNYETWRTACWLFGDDDELFEKLDWYDFEIEKRLLKR